jgi:pimeloyl-ACP methyl ester carboxylesterase
VNGHDVKRHRGRSHSEASALVAAAMQRLLWLGNVEPRSKFVEFEGGRLHHLDAGAGPVVVLLQGAGGGAANWYRIIGPLSRERRVLALDLPGFGLSSSMEVRPPLGGVAARVVEGWLTALGVGEVDVVGTSFGGLIGLRLAQLYPGRVRRLALLDSAGLGRELPWAVRIAGFPLVWRLALRPTRTGTDRLFRWLLTSRRDDLAGHEQALVDYLWRSAAAGDVRGMARAIRLFGGPRGQREVLSDAELRELRLPVQVIWGELDRFLPVAHGLRAARHIPGARAEVLTGVGHSPNWEAPDALLDVLWPFLEKATA